MTPTLEVVEELANQLSEEEQKMLLERLGAKWQSAPSPLPVTIQEQDERRAQRLRLARQLLAEVAHIEDDSQGTSDSVEVLRRIRAGRQE